jgi:hypothetical protein
MVRIFGKNVGKRKFETALSIETRYVRQGDGLNSINAFDVDRRTAYLTHYVEDDY